MNWDEVAVVNVEADRGSVKRCKSESSSMNTKGVNVMLSKNACHEQKEPRSHPRLLTSKTSGGIPSIRVFRT